MAMLQNIDLIGRHFPNWKVYVYSAPDVDPGFLTQIAMYSNVVVKPTGKLGAVNMIERFFAIDEPDVEVMFVRDADSRVHWRDRWAIQDFLSKPEFIAHSIRDNREHTASMMGGLWGMRKTDKISISKQYERYLERPIDRGFGADQSFLSTYVYPYVRDVLLVHVGGGANAYMHEAFISIPFPSTNQCYCGRIEELSFKDTPPQLTFVNGRFKL